jgi:Xaa-Pro aminopeptidase
MKPGAVPAELFDANNRLLKAKGYMAEGRLFAHGQGYDLVERPGIRPEEKMTLKAGMVLAIHPITLNKRAYAFCCDNFLITEKGAELMHKTPRKVFVI